MQLEWKKSEGGNCRFLNVKNIYFMYIEVDDICNFLFDFVVGGSAH